MGQSMVKSEYPSKIPSMIPSSTLSLIPSTIPSSVPSRLPIKKLSVIPSMIPPLSILPQILPEKVSMTTFPSSLMSNVSRNYLPSGSPSKFAKKSSLNLQNLHPSPKLPGTAPSWNYISNPAINQSVFPFVSPKEKSTLLPSLKYQFLNNTTVANLFMIIDYKREDFVSFSYKSAENALSEFIVDTFPLLLESGTITQGSINIKPKSARSSKKRGKRSIIFSFDLHLRYINNVVMTSLPIVTQNMFNKEKKRLKQILQKHQVGKPAFVSVKKIKPHFYSKLQTYHT